MENPTNNTPANDTSNHAETLGRVESASQHGIPQPDDLSRAIALYRADPRRGFDLLYRALSPRLATFLRRAFTLDGEEMADVVHDSFLPWVENPEKMNLVENPRAYLFATAKYLALQKRRANARDRAAQIPEATSGQTSNLETAIDVNAALERLPEEQREVVALKIWGDLTFDEIAVVQEISLNTAASRYRYALQKLKEILA